MASYVLPTPHNVPTPNSPLTAYPSSNQSDLGKKLQEANVDPLAQEATARTTGSTTTIEDEQPEVVKAEQQEEKKVEKLEHDPKPSG